VRLGGRPGLGLQIKFINTLTQEFTLYPNNHLSIFPGRTLQLVYNDSLHFEWLQQDAKFLLDPQYIPQDLCLVFSFWCKLYATNIFVLLYLLY
jgi:hypothetical protein